MRARAFTLVEILLVVALIGLLSAALVSTSSNLLSEREKRPEAVVWAAVKEARKQALRTQSTFVLSCPSVTESKAPRIMIEGAGGTKQPFEFPSSADLSVELLRAKSDGGSVLVGGQLVDTQTLPGVNFYADGTCDPFRVQIRTGGIPRILAIDPWTCARVINEAAP